MNNTIGKTNNKIGDKNKNKLKQLKLEIHVHKYVPINKNIINDIHISVHNSDMLHMYIMFV